MLFKVHISQILLSVDVGSVLPNPELASTLSIPTPTSFPNSQSMALQASLALWKYTAQKVTREDTFMLKQ